MKTLLARGAWVVAAAALAMFVVAGCSGKGSTPATSTQEKPYTKDFFGSWNEEVAKKHLPEIVCEKTADGGLTVTVTVPHVMDPNKPHYIEWIRIEDGDGNALGQVDLKPTDPKPVAVFTLKASPAKIRATERCNVHGIWMSEADVK